MIDFSQLLVLLREAVAEPVKLPTLVPKFQELVWHSEISYPSELADETMRDLAYDLDFYVADPKQRAEDSSYFGEERALAEIRSALAAIETDQKPV
jgi:hypothetical protein